MGVRGVMPCGIGIGMLRTSNAGDSDWCRFGPPRQRCLVNLGVVCDYRGRPHSCRCCMLRAPVPPWLSSSSLAINERRSAWTSMTGFANRILEAVRDGLPLKMSSSPAGQFLPTSRASQRGRHSVYRVSAKPLACGVEKYATPLDSVLCRPLSWSVRRSSRGTGPDALFPVILRWPVPELF